MSCELTFSRCFRRCLTRCWEPAFPSGPHEKGLVSYHLTNIRDFATDPHKSVDDKPFGGGPGMVMMCQTIFDAVESVERQDRRPKPVRSHSADPARTLVRSVGGRGIGREGSSVAHRRAL